MKMKFTSLLKNIIVEDAGRIGFLIDKFTKPTKQKDGTIVPATLKVETLAALIAADPDSKMNDVDIESASIDDLKKVRAGKYSQWLIKQYLNLATKTQNPRELKSLQRIFLEDLYKTTIDLTKYDRNKQKFTNKDDKDINKISIERLRELVKDISLTKKTSKEERKEASKSYKHPHSNVVFNGTDWTVVEISKQDEQGREAAQFYGGYNLLSEDPDSGETNWCTSPPGRSNHFFHYINQGPLYVIIPNNWSGKVGKKSGLPAERYQFHFEDSQFKDAADDDIDITEFFNVRAKELKEFFLPKFIKMLMGGLTSTVTISDFNSDSTAAMMSIYGLDVIFDHIPENVEVINIFNNTNKKVSVELPSSIGRFKNLQMMSLTNCISKIPKEICNCTSLEFLNFTKNKDLTTFPACLIDLPNLESLNFTGCVNLNPPPEAKKIQVPGNPYLYIP